MAIQIKRSRVIAHLSLTPLIDVVFLLLVFFLVTSKLEDEEQRLPIQLPTAESITPLVQRPAAPAPAELRIDIDATGNVFLDGVASDWSDLSLALQQRLPTTTAADQPTTTAANETPAVVLRADAQVSFQPVVRALEICHRLGISDCTVMIRPNPPNSDPG